MPDLHFHAAQVYRKLEANLPALDLEDHVIDVLELRHIFAARDGQPSADRRIGSGDVRDVMDVKGGSDHLRLGRADGGAEADAADLDRISLAVESHRALAAGDADNESGLVDGEIEAGISAMAAEVVATPARASEAVSRAERKIWFMAISIIFGQAGG